MFAIQCTSIHVYFHNVSLQTESGGSYLVIYTKIMIVHVRKLLTLHHGSYTHQSVPCYLIPNNLCHVIIYPTICAMLSYTQQSVPCYHIPNNLCHVIIYPTICAMLSYTQQSVPCYHIPDNLCHVIIYPTICAMLSYTH